MTYPTASTGLTRDVNRAAILRLISSSGLIARKTIARRLGLSPATVTAVTRELIEQGLVRVAERAPSNGGRPALLLELVGGAATAFGAKIAADHVVGVRVDLEANVLERHEVAFDSKAPDALDRLGDVLAGWLGERTGGPPLLGVGLGVPGFFDGQTGMLDSPLLGWHGVELAEVLERRLQVPVFVDNDVNTLAVAERLYGRGQDAEHFVTVTIGLGVGLGIVTDGDIYRGYRGGAGELGHTTAVVDGEPCTCGKRGCLETVVADPALVRRARSERLIGPRQGVAQLRALADKGDAGARAIYAAAGTTLGRSVADLVNVLGPQVVLISGEGTGAWSHLAEAFEREFRATLFPPLGDVPVEVDPWDDAKWARGAAALVLRQTFVAGIGDEEPRQLVRARLGQQVAV
jgi:predicted NBD/HSP70 family sugar kinase